MSKRDALHCDGDASILQVTYAIPEPVERAMNARQFFVALQRIFHSADMAQPLNLSIFARSYESPSLRSSCGMFARIFGEPARHSPLPGVRRPDGCCINVRCSVKQVGGSI
jgi:hypothetical protein